MSTGSPIRGTYTTQKRAVRDSTINRHQNLSQKSPALDSPNLNEEN